MGCVCCRALWSIPVLATLLALGKCSQPSSQPLRCHSWQVHLNWSLYSIEYCPECLYFSFHCVQLMRIRTKFSWRLFSTQKRYCETFHFLPSSSRILTLKPSWSEIAESEAETTTNWPTLCDPVDCSSHQAHLPTEFSRQEYWSEEPFPSPGNLPDQGSKLGLLHCRQILYHLSYQGSPQQLASLSWQHQLTNMNSVCSCLTYFGRVIPSSHLRLNRKELLYDSCFQLEPEVPQMR